MFTIEHSFDATVVTLVDEGKQHLQEDIVITMLADCVNVEQVNPRTDMTERITLSNAQLKDLIEALNLPEGSYRRSEN